MKDEDVKINITEDSVETAVKITLDPASTALSWQLGEDADVMWGWTQVEHTHGMYKVPLLVVRLPDKESPTGYKQVVLSFASPTTALAAMTGLVRTLHSEIFSAEITAWAMSKYADKPGLDAMLNPADKDELIERLMRARRQRDEDETN